MSGNVRVRKRVKSTDLDLSSPKKRPAASTKSRAKDLKSQIIALEVSIAEASMQRDWKDSSPSRSRASSSTHTKPRVLHQQRNASHKRGVLLFVEWSITLLIVISLLSFAYHFWKSSMAE